MNFVWFMFAMSVCCALVAIYAGVKDQKEGADAN
jgi:hypothetical protein